MSESTPKTPQELAQERIEAAQTRRALLKRELADALVLQAAADAEAIADLETTEGYARVIAIDLSNVWRPGIGAPTRIAVVVPEASDGLAQRFIEQVNKYKEGSKERLAAQDALATECWRYPERGSDEFKAARQIAPLILSNAALQIVHAAQGVAQEAGKD